MEERIYFDVEKENGTTEKMELLAKIRDDELNKSYIFYKNCDDEDIHYYAASYDETDENKFVNLDTDLSDLEKAKLNKIFERLRTGGAENA